MDDISKKDIREWITREAFGLGFEIVSVLKNKISLERDLLKIMTAVREWSDKRDAIRKETINE